MDKKLFRSIVWLIVIAAAAVLFVWRIDDVARALDVLFSVLAPLVTGFVIAFVINKPFSWVYKWLHKLQPNTGKENKFAKMVSMVVAYGLFFGVVVLVFAILVPQLAASIEMLVANRDIYAENLESVYNWATRQLNVTGITEEDVVNVLQEIYENVSVYLKGLVPAIFNITQSVIHSVTNVFIGFAISFYFLYDKNHLVSQLKRLILAYTPTKFSEKALYIGKVANETFSSFVSGQLTEAVILGVLCFVCMTILQFPYAMLISVMVGISNLIPIIGPIIGTIPGAFILLMVNPMQAVWFVVLVIVLQQIDGNIIYPRVVGTSVGLPALWVLVAVTVGGSLFGLSGMILAVPSMSVLFKLIKEDSAAVLEEKGIEPTQYQ